MLMGMRTHASRKTYLATEAAIRRYIEDVDEEYVNEHQKELLHRCCTYCKALWPN
jgi:hypothetical protein